MPNMEALKVLGIGLDDWKKLSEEEKAEAYKKAAQLISDAHPPVTITYGEQPTPSSRRHSRGGGE